MSIGSRYRDEYTVECVIRLKKKKDIVFYVSDKINSDIAIDLTYTLYSELNTILNSFSYGTKEIISNYFDDMFLFTQPHTFNKFYHFKMHRDFDTILKYILGVRL